MARTSQWSRLPEDLRTQAESWRRAGVTVAEIRARLAERGHDFPESTIHYHIQALDERLAGISAEIARTRAAAEVLAGMTEGRAPDEVRRANIELLHTVIFRAVTQRVTPDDDAEPADAKELKLLADAVLGLTRAAKADLDVIAAAERHARDAAKEEAACAAETAGRAAGLSAETLAMIRQEIYGIGA